jgi:hypothetical protein
LTRMMGPTSRCGSTGASDRWCHPASFTESLISQCHLYRIAHCTLPPVQNRSFHTATCTESLTAHCHLYRIAHFTLPTAYFRLMAASRIRPKYVAGELLGYGSMDGSMASGDLLGRRAPHLHHERDGQRLPADTPPSTMEGDGTTGFWMKARCTDNDARAAPAGAVTEMYFPAHYAQCANSTRVNGSAQLHQLVTHADGSVVVTIACTSSGEFYASSAC